MYHPKDTIVGGSGGINIAQLVIGSVITLENVALILVMCRTPKLHTTRYIFTVSLSISDVLVGMTFIQAAAFTLVRGSSHFGTKAEIPVYYMAIAMTMFSSFHMAVIAVERYLYIAHPYFYRNHVTRRTIRLVVVVFWVTGVSMTVAVLSIKFFGSTTPNTIPGRTKGSPLEFGGYLFHFLSVSAITCISYVMILYQVEKHKETFVMLGGKSRAPKRNEYAKSVKFFITVFGANFVMASPVYTVEFISQFVTVSPKLRGFCITLFLLNSGANAVILLMIDQQLRRVLSNTFHKCGHCFIVKIGPASM